MLDKNKLDLYDGEYKPEPFVLAGESKTVSIIVSVAVALGFVVLLGNTVFSNAQENDIEGVLNAAISVAAGFLMYIGMKGFYKLAYDKKVKKEAEEFEKMKREAIPYTVCEFCGGRIERKYYKTRDVIPQGAKGGDVTENGIDSFTCAECGYWVDCHTYDQFIHDKKRLRYYTLVAPKIVEGSPMDEEKLTKGRLVAYLNKKEHPEVIES